VRIKRGGKRSTKIRGREVATVGRKLSGWKNSQKGRPSHGPKDKEEVPGQDPKMRKEPTVGRDSTKPALETHPIPLNHLGREKNHDRIEKDSA